MGLPSTKNSSLQPPLVLPGGGGCRGSFPGTSVPSSATMFRRLVAGTLGIKEKTYLVTDCRIDRGEPAHQPDQEGTLEELLADIQKRKGIFAF